MNWMPEPTGPRRLQLSYRSFFCADQRTSGPLCSLTFAGSFRAGWRLRLALTPIHLASQEILKRSNHV